MTMTNDSGGGGGMTTTGGVCWIDPADQQAYNNDILTRLTKIEKVLSLLLGMDISAASLADLSSSAGSLTDVMAVLSNAAGGWITDGTFTGVAISSLGWTLSDGNVFPVVTMVDGVLQFGFTQGGAAAGTLVDYWNAGGAASGTPTGIPAYADVGWHQDVLATDILKNITIASRSRGAGVGTIKLNFAATGKYLCIGNVTQYVSPGATAGAIINGYLTLGIAPSTLLAAADISGVISSGGFARESVSVSRIFDITSTSQQILLGWQTGILDGSCTFDNPYELSLQIIGLGV